MANVNDIKTPVLDTLRSPDVERTSEDVAIKLNDDLSVALSRENDVNENAFYSRAAYIRAVVFETEKGPVDGEITSAESGPVSIDERDDIVDEAAAIKEQNATIAEAVESAKRELESTPSAPGM